MSDALFPKFRGLAWDVKVTPFFSTIVQTAASGREVRAALMSAPRWKLNLHYEVLRADPRQVDDSGYTEIDRLVGFFLARQGAYDSFLLNLSDVTGRVEDSAFADQPASPATGDGVTKLFQLQRRVGDFLEPLQNPAGQSAKIYVAGVLQATTAYTIANGLVSFTTPPAAGASVTADFVMLWRVCFDPDELEFNNLYYLIWECQDLPLISVRV